MKHASVPEEYRRQLGIIDGLENVEDLMNDIENALQYAFN